MLLLLANLLANRITAVAVQAWYEAIPVLFPNVVDVRLVPTDLVLFPLI